MKRKLQTFIRTAAGIGVIASAVAAGCGRDIENGMVPMSPAVGIQAPKSEQREKIPEFTEEEYRDISIPTFYELADDNAVTDAHKTVLYKLHAQNKSIDSLPMQSYGKPFLADVIAQATKRADDTFPLYADALWTAEYDLALLHSELSENQLFRIKMDLMVPLTSIAAKEEKKYGRETDESKELLYRISFMGEKQLYEIIERLKDRLPSAFSGNDRQYAENIASQISNLGEYHGWLDGLKRLRSVSAIPRSFYERLNNDLPKSADTETAETVAGR